MRYFATLLWIVFAIPSVAQNPKEDYETLKKFYRHQARQINFHLDPEGKQKLQLEAPVMTWTGLDYQGFRDTNAPNSGDVYVWTYQGRAIVAGGVLSLPLNYGHEVYQEFQALVETPPQPIVSRCDWGVMWAPPGIQPRPLPGAMPPAEGSDASALRQRDLQMRGLAKQFTAETRSATTGEIHPLKLQPKAVFRLNQDELRESDSHVVDGCLFIFTNQLGTDPELTLLLECHRTDKGLQWMYAPGSLAFQELWLKHKDKEVWHLPNFLQAPGERNFVSTRLYGGIKIDQMKDLINE
ncbi:hypothetical protein [Rhodopirellula sp. MGV]|uniref:hypothetical protein n=1 Tax=Rhodopirellula sp. MGV TaxID=2023130 RepID=UPI000B96C2A4|nr:hypothetical protein [Rhodopirellula sp. MGV]OYP36512.1 hypothetical protein CGZ80_08275 [Rhodopirellula sp. MGV]PNY37848.1 hypothetical protein C2E31_04900 [Rhodopirellula baltica]